MSVPCEINCVYTNGASCAPVREPSSAGRRGLDIENGTKRFLTAYINRARLDKTVSEFSRASFARKIFE